MQKEENLQTAETQALNIPVVSGSNIDKILSGEIIPSFTVVDYNTEEGKKVLLDLKKEQDDIMKKKEVNWEKLNKFVIKPF